MRHADTRAFIKGDHHLATRCIRPHLPPTKNFLLHSFHKIACKIHHEVTEDIGGETVADPGFPVGGAPTSDAYTFRQKRLQK